ncbi:MAG: saccharopine dehydrogenase family protein [Chloroflexota bacterium]
MARIVALGGAGHIGSCGVRELAKRAPDIEIVIADYNLEAATALAAEVGGRASAVKVDANDFAGLVRTLQGADVVISTIGPYYKYGETVVKAAIEARCNLVDVCDDGDAVKKELDLDESARRAGISAIVGLGATPGITNLMAKRGSDRLDRVDEIQTAWGWTAIDPKMTGPAIVEHYLHAVTGSIVSYKDGGWVEIPAMSTRKEVEFIAPVGLFGVAEVGHPEPVTLPRYIKGVREVTNFGGVWPKSFEDLAMVFVQLGLAGQKDLDIKGTKVPTRDVVTSIILQILDLAPDLVDRLVSEVYQSYGVFGLEGVVLRTDVRGEKDGQPTTFSYGCGSNADLLTSLPAVLGALMLIRGQISQKGVAAPEGVVDPKAFFGELVKDIPVQEMVSRPISL